MSNGIAGLNLFIDFVSCSALVLMTPDLYVRAGIERDIEVIDGCFTIEAYRDRLRFSPGGESFVNASISIEVGNEVISRDFTAPSFDTALNSVFEFIRGRPEVVHRDGIFDLLHRHRAEMEPKRKMGVIESLEAINLVIDNDDVKPLSFGNRRETLGLKYISEETLLLYSEEDGDFKREIILIPRVVSEPKYDAAYMRLFTETLYLSGTTKLSDEKQEVAIAKASASVADDWF